MSTPQDPWQVPAPDGQPGQSGPPPGSAPGYGPPPAGWGQPAYGDQPVPSYGQPPPGPPQPGPATSQWGSPPAYGQQQWGGPPPSQHRGTNGMAVASLVLSIVWLYWIGSVLALVFGYLAKKQIARTGEGGAGLATAGIVIGWIGIAMLVLVVVAFVLLGAAGFSEGSVVTETVTVPG